jgi:endonuclease/exonuclease/phosphatase family metal-dependent hydrolase
VSAPLPRLDDPTAPAQVALEMAALRTALDDTIPRKRPLGRNLLVGTWNLKNFGSLTEQWLAGAADSPKRDFRGLWAVAEIVSRFDVVALQEVCGDLRALRTLMKTLGPSWNFLMTDTSRGSKGGGERMAYLFDATRVELSGLAGEVVVPPEWLSEIAPGALREQFARAPYAVSFQAGDATIILVTLHVLYGSQPDDRIPELTAIARWMADWAQQANRWHHNLVVLGDFNIDRQDDPLYRAFTSTGLKVPAALNSVRRSIFADLGQPTMGKYYDQIAWFEQGHAQLINLRLLNAGGFDFVPHLYRDVSMNKAQMQFRVSDHYPLWVEFGM